MPLLIESLDEILKSMHIRWMIYVKGNFHASGSSNNVVAERN
jgi:hypothetical protein